MARFEAEVRSQPRVGSDGLRGRNALDLLTGSKRASKSALGRSSGVRRVVWRDETGRGALQPWIGSGWSRAWARLPLGNDAEVAWARGQLLWVMQGFQRASGRTGVNSSSPPHVSNHSLSHLSSSLSTCFLTSQGMDLGIQCSKTSPGIPVHTLDMMPHFAMVQIQTKQQCTKC